MYLINTVPTPRKAVKKRPENVKDIKLLSKTGFAHLHPKFEFLLTVEKSKNVMMTFKVRGQLFAQILKIILSLASRFSP